jgi:phage terminase small subunit
MTGFLEPHALPEGPNTPALDRLNERRRAFVLHYVLGEDGVRGVAYKAYFAAGFEAKDNNVAGAAAYQLMNDSTVKLAIDELRAEIEKEARAKLKPWTNMALKAQELLELHILTEATPRLTEEEKKIHEVAGIPVPKDGYLPDGRPRVFLGTESIAVCKEVIDRAYGRANQPHTHDLGPKLEDMLKSLAHRDRNPQLPPGQNVGDLEAHVIPIDRRISDS